MQGLVLITSLATIAAALCSLSLCTPSSQGWTFHRRADSHAPLRMQLLLAQSNIDNLDAYLLDVSHPESPNYGRHWTTARVAETFRPSQESAHAVHSWLVNECGINEGKIVLSEGHDVYTLDITVAEAEDALTSECLVYRDNFGRERIDCQPRHAIPDHISKHIDFVWPVMDFGHTKLRHRDAHMPFGSYNPVGIRRPTRGLSAPFKEAHIGKGLRHCDTAVTLDCLRALYNFDHKLVASHKNTVAIAEFGQNIYQSTDLDMFFKQFAPDSVGHQPTLVSIAGGRLNASDHDPAHLGEASLDFELLMGLLGHKQEVLLYQTGMVATDPLIADKLFAAVDASYCSLPGVAELGLKDCGTKPLANVMSVSYTSFPDIRDPSVLPILQRQCFEIGKLSLTGVTVVASSGDNGVAFGTADGQSACSVNGTLVPGDPKGSFVGSFPASCPYVTAVGGTSISPGKTVHDPETATTVFPSGGGFSNAFPRPHFQTNAVKHYLEHFAPPYGPDVFNRSGRAYPDVAASGFPLVVAVAGNFTLSGGTSASAPIFAALIAAVNDARLGAGKRPVGWINPALYSRSFAHAFNDVTNGTNPACGTDGFAAAPGWDPVTGLGTPNFKRMLASFMSLP